LLIGEAEMGEHSRDEPLKAPPYHTTCSFMADEFLASSLDRPPASTHATNYLTKPRLRRRPLKELTTTSSGVTHTELQGPQSALMKQKA
jgi:hypothetical protein